MIYLTDNDVHAHIQIRLKDESQSDFQTAIDEIEKQNIELISSYLASRYDVAVIFDEDAPISNGLLKRILTYLVLYDLVRRNAARKVPSDYKDNYDEAMKLLQKINSGVLQLENLPATTDGDGNELSSSIWGNNRNEDFYI